MNWKGLNNNWITKGLFIEYRYIPKVGDHCMYTLSPEDKDSYPSLRRLYLESPDPTEYLFSVIHLGGWDHWKYLCDESFFKPTVLLWRDEYLIRMKSQALAEIQLAAKGEGKLSYDANKYLLEEGWTKEPRRATQGRRSKQIISEEAEKLINKNNHEKSQINEDYLRIIK